MSDKKDSISGSNPLTALHDFGKILAESLRGSPFLSFLAFALVLCAFVTWSYETELAVVGFFSLVLCALLIGYMFSAKVREQRSHIKGVPKNIHRGNIKSFRLLSSTDTETKTNIITLLNSIREEASESLDLAIENTRINIFGDDEGTMRMIPDLAVNMTRTEEHSITMPSGYGSTGRAFSSKSPNIAIFKKGWGKSSITDTELKKAHPDLRWIISMPIVLMANEPITVGVLNLDGLNIRKSEQELQGMARSLLFYSGAISMLLTNIITKGLKQ